MFEYQASGSLRVIGCAGLNFQKKYIVLFSVGDKAYLKKKARFGKMEFVVIKRIARQIPEIAQTYGSQPEIMYVDTFNRIWAEYELMLKENALDLATLYWEHLKQEGRSLFEENGCFPIKPEGCD
jgi:hypothetical protein